jgi:TetR/AcrR family transcriptional regulator, repressor for neighboring sulfatase
MRSRGRPTGHEGAPHGPQAVREALIGAAVTVFAERGVRSVSVKQVATAAGVNAGLVHRYVGTKDDLVRAAVHRASDEHPASSRRLSDYERILAHLAMEGYDLSSLDLDFPLTRELIDAMVTGGFTDRQARLRTVCSLALSSWHVLGPLISLAAELDDEDRAAMDGAVEQTRRWIATP